MAAILTDDKQEQLWQDPSQSHWMNLLPDLTDLDILKVGARRAENLVGLCRRSGRPIACLGEQNGTLVDAQIRFYPTPEQLSASAYDVAVIDEQEFFQTHRSAGAVSAALQRLAAALKPGGWLVVCLPDGLGALGLRKRITALLSSAGFAAIQRFACEPSAELPLRIVPLDEDPRRDALALCSFPGSVPRSGRAGARDSVKRVLYRVLGIYNPRFGMVVVARKGVLAGSEPSFQQKVAEIVRAACRLPSQTPLTVLLETYPRTSRQYFFVRDKASAELLSVGKLFDHVEQMFVPWFDPLEHARQEFEKGQAIFSLSPVFEARRITLPEPLHFEIIKPSTLTLQRAVRGFRLDRLMAGAKRQGDRGVIVPLLRQLGEMQIFVQEQLCAYLQDRLPQLPQWYFENDLCLPIQPLEQMGLRRELFQAVQHGDFALVNLYFDAPQKRWALTDWEWTAVGFPPMFDLFSLIRSFGYGVKEAEAVSLTAGALASIEHALFEDNWFSQAARELLLRYCEHFQIPPTCAYDLFLHHLLVLGNRYRGDFRPDGFRTAYVQAIQFAVENRDAFILSPR
jgi:hypothetical protein